jgi:hypothetical protein
MSHQKHEKYYKGARVFKKCLKALEKAALAREAPDRASDVAPSCLRGGLNPNPAKNTSCWGAR